MNDVPDDPHCIPTATPDTDDLVSSLIGLRDRELRGFSPGAAPAAEPEDEAHEHSFALRAVSVADTISLLLEVLPAHPLPAYDKTAWAFAFEFQGVQCRLRWERSGLKLSFWLPHGEAERADGLGEKVEKRLTKAAMNLYKRAIRPRVECEIERNHVTVLNQTLRYRGMVDYFIKQVHRVRESDPPHPGINLGEGPLESGLSSILNELARSKQRDEELTYLATALVATYFAYAQHAMVVLSAFSPRALDADFSVKRLLDAKWADQFDIAFPLPHQGIVGRAKQDLSRLADRYRNPLLHGGGGYPTDGMFVNWAPGRSILVTDEDGILTDRYMLWQSSLSSEDLDEILGRIRNVDEVFEAHQFYPWLRSGLAADFRPEAVGRALGALEAGTVESFTERADAAFDHSVNWD
ncbi:hypothetical protein EEB14_25710 [Rhodococcus sp. WS4]|nr:hypothetical protein EEB14_25710 [Rhodococcus sp. WS4]